MDDIIKKRLAEEEQDWLIGTYYYYTAFISRHVSHQFGNAKAHINKHTQIKSMTEKVHKISDKQLPQPHIKGGREGGWEGGGKKGNLKERGRKGREGGREVGEGGREGRGGMTVIHTLI